jgi:hypothetical protein
MRNALRTCLLLCFCLLADVAKAQCDKLYTQFETGCVYAPGEDSLMKFIRQNLLPVISKLPDTEKQRITKLLIVMTIDTAGKIVNIHLPHFTGSPETAQELKNRIAAMKGWTIGKVNEVPVCTEVFWGANCLLWK